MEQEMKTINLEEILSKHDKYNDISVELKSSILSAMKEACEQVLELASENGNLKIYRENMYIPNDNEMLIENEYNYVEWNSNGADYHVDVTINKQSILDTINQIK